MKKILILLLTLFCAVSCGSLYQEDSSAVVYVKVFQRLGPRTALCYKCHYDDARMEYTRLDSDVIKLVTNQFSPREFGIYKLKESHIRTGSTYTYETERGKWKTVMVWEYYY